MKLTQGQKVDVLTKGLEERYHSIHLIRDRVQNISVWSLGLLLAATGWIVESEMIFTSQQKSVYIAIVLIAFGVLRYYMSDLAKGFKSQQKVAVGIEKALGFYEGQESIYPQSWQASGDKASQGRFFLSSYLLLDAGVIFLIFAILASGCILGNQG